jgi:hypothetical protein
VSRATTILDRFPRHLDAAQPGKVFGNVVGSLAQGLDVQTSQVGQVRRAHRLSEAEEELDLLRLAGLHGLTSDALAVLRRRRAVAGLTYEPWLDLVRGTVRSLVADHRTGNGTVAGLAGAAGAYTGLAVDRLVHSEDGYWHLATCHDVVAPATVPDLVAIEENPLQAKDISPVARRHADRFRITRSGFDAVAVTIVVRGVDDRTVQPMVVDVDAGFGIATTVDVPAGSELRFERDGRATLDGTSVARFSYTFTGAVFADADASHPKDVVFADEASGDQPADPRAFFAVTQPVADAFDPAPTFPHAEGTLGAATMARGESRWACFVGAGTYAGGAEPEPVEAAPFPLAARYDRSVFMPDPAGPPSLEVGFAWDDHEPFAVRVWLPIRLADLDGDGETPVREQVRILLDRHRAGGVHVYVAYADPRWVLGTGILRDLSSTEALGQVVAGTATWAGGTPQAPT